MILEQSGKIQILEARERWFNWRLTVGERELRIEQHAAADSEALKEYVANITHFHEFLQSKLGAVLEVIDMHPAPSDRKKSKHFESFDAIVKDLFLSQAPAFESFRCRVIHHSFRKLANRLENLIWAIQGLLEEQLPYYDLEFAEEEAVICDTDIQNAIIKRKRIKIEGLIVHEKIKDFQEVLEILSSDNRLYANDLGKPSIAKNVRRSGRLVKGNPEGQLEGMMMCFEVASDLDDARTQRLEFVRSITAIWRPQFDTLGILYQDTNQNRRRI